MRTMWVSELAIKFCILSYKNISDFNTTFTLLQLAVNLHYDNTYIYIMQLNTFFKKGEIKCNKSIILIVYEVPIDTTKSFDMAKIDIKSEQAALIILEL